jgi:hypothetical protein
MDSHQAIQPDALRVNANLFQTDLCRNPEPGKACKHYIHVIWIPAIHVGMTLLKPGRVGTCFSCPRGTNLAMQNGGQKSAAHPTLLRVMARCQGFYSRAIKPFPLNPIVLCLLIRFVYCQFVYCQPALRHEPLAFLYAENLFYLCLYWQRSF